MLDVAGLPIVRQWYVIRRSDKVLLPPAQAMFDFLGSEGSNYLPDCPNSARDSRRNSAHQLHATVAARITMIWSRRSVVKMRLKVVIACPGRIEGCSVGKC